MTAAEAEANTAIRKAARRLLPFVFALYVVAYLDRVNVAFAKLTMTKDLGFSEAVFGLGAGLFFIGYVLLEIPGALIVEHWSARRWFARILLTWGFAAVLTGFIQTKGQFYAARIALGVAEAGFFPGMIVYLTHWFPRQVRARAMAGLTMAVPFGLAIGAPVSGLLLTRNWLGLAGWRWVFILEGIPAIVLGLVTLLYLPDRPVDARWLTAREAAWIDRALDAERRAKRAAQACKIRDSLRHRDVLLLAAALFFANIGVSGLLLWLPDTLERASGFSASGASALAAVPFTFGVAAAFLASRSSDRTRERRLHAAVPLLLTGILFASAARLEPNFPLLLLVLSLAVAANYAWPPPFWVLPTLVLGETAAATAIGFINCVGNLGGFFGPAVTGYLLAKGRAFAVAAGFLSCCFCAAACFISAVKREVVPRRG